MIQERIHSNLSGCPGSNFERSDSDALAKGAGALELMLYDEKTYP